MTSTNDESVDSRLVIDCDECVQRHSDVCDDCVVTFLTRADRQAVVIDLGEVRALRALSDGGLAPRLRHQAASGR